MSSLQQKKFKSLNLANYDNDLVIESDDDSSGEDTLNLISHNLSSIPPEIALNKAQFITTLILTKNRLRVLKNLKYFTNLVSLQLDRNKLRHIRNLPSLPKLTTLWLNNNNLKDLNSLLIILKKSTPNLEDLSLLLNPLCPSLNESKKDHNEYRLNVIRNLPQLKCLDGMPVTSEERQQSEKIPDLFLLNGTGYSSVRSSLSISSNAELLTPLRSPKTPTTPYSPMSPVTPTTPMSPMILSTPATPKSKKSSKVHWSKKDKMVRYQLNGEEFRVYSYYKPQKIIGSGAFGVVCSAIDQRNGKKVAIKKNKYVFGEMSDAKNTLREMKLLQYFTHYKHCDIIEIYDCIAPRIDETQTFAHIYVIMPLYETTLLDIINSRQALTHSHFQYLTYQILRGLSFIHRSGVIHRDIKPENVLVNGTDCDIKIIDFGTSRGIYTAEQYKNAFDVEITEYVCTRWYRAPEVMCNAGKYDMKMDIWSVGCILAEMILKKPLFPGDNYMDQLQQIFDTMDGNTDWIVNEQAKQWINKNKKSVEHELKDMISETLAANNSDIDNKNDNNKNDQLLNEQCIDLLYKLLALNPKDRISANDALKHAYFKNYFENDQDNVSGINLIYNGNENEHKPFDLSFEFEKGIQTQFGLRHKMQSELYQIHEKRWKKIIKKRHRKSSIQYMKKSHSVKLKRRSRRRVRDKANDKIEDSV